MDLERLHGRLAVAVGLDRVAVAGQRRRVVLAQCRFVLDDRDELFHRRIIAHGGNLRMEPREALHYSPRSSSDSPDLRHEGSVMTPDTGLVDPTEANHDDITGHQLRPWADRGTCLEGGRGNVVVAASRSDAQLAGARITARCMERVRRSSAEAAPAGGFTALFSRLRAGGGASQRAKRRPLDALSRANSRKCQHPVKRAAPNGAVAMAATESKKQILI